MQPEPLIRYGPYLVDWRDGAGDTLTIVFSSVGHDPDRPPSPEFVTTTRGLGRTLFIRDTGRSWANDPAFGPMLHRAVQAATTAPVRRIITMGLSMGAFSALAATRFVPVDVVLAFGPQWSLAGEDRWRQWTGRLPPTRATIPATSWTVVFHGLRDDHDHAMGFPQQRGLDHILFPDFGHSDLMGHLKSRGGLTGMAQAALAGDRRRLLRIASGGGGKRRA